MSAPRIDKNEERRQALLHTLSDVQPATTPMLAELVGQYPVTVLRDLRTLEARGLVVETGREARRGIWWRVT